MSKNCVQNLPPSLLAGCIPNLYKDATVESLGNFVKDKLNQRLQDYFSVPEFLDDYNGILDPLQLKEIVAVNTLQIGDLPMTSTLEFPILKMYRISTTSKRVENYRESYISIMYGLNLPILEILPGFLNWICFYMDISIDEWQKTIYTQLNPFTRRDFIAPVQWNYSLLQANLTNEIIYSLRGNLMLRES